GTGSDDHGVVLSSEWLGTEAEQVGDAGRLRAHHRLAADDPNNRAVGLTRQRAAPPLHRIRSIWLHPRKRDLVAVEKVTQLGAGRIPALPDDNRARWRSLGSERLQ